VICAVFGENRVTLRGHADYAPRGEDIVCAAASALVFALIGALEEKEQLRELVIKPGLVTVAAEGDCRAEWQLGTREAIPANWLVALALLGVSWCVLTVFLSVRYRAANAMEIYPEEYSTVYRLCNVVPLLAAVLAALCVVF